MIAVARTDKAVKAFEEIEDFHSPPQNSIFQTFFDRHCIRLQRENSGFIVSEEV